MSKSRSRAAKAVPTATRRQRAPNRKPAPAHLPLQAPAERPSVPSPIVALAPAAPVKVPKKRDRSVLPGNSVVRQKVLAIIALRLQGDSAEQIGKTLNLTTASIRQYLYLAGKNGWLSKRAIDPTDRLEFEISQKVVRNLDEMLDSENTERRDTATLKTAEGMLFKRFAEQTQAAPLAVIGIKVEMPAGATTTMREGTTGGQERWLEGTTIENPKRDA